MAAWADGWLPMLVSPDDLAVEMAHLREECARRGRDPDEIEVTVFEYDPGGSRSKSQDLVGRYAAAGADRMVIIEGLGDHMGSAEWSSWSPDSFEAQLDQVAGRFL